MRGSLAYIFWGLLMNMQYVKRVRGKIVFVSKFFVCRGELKGSETLLMLILSEKDWLSTRTLHRLYISDEKMSLITGKIEKAYLAHNFFYFPERRNSRHFKLGAWRTAKTRACLLRFNLLKLMQIFSSSTPFWGKKWSLGQKCPHYLPS